MGIGLKLYSNTHKNPKYSQNISLNTAESSYFPLFENVDWRTSLPNLLRGDEANVLFK